MENYDDLIKKVANEFLPSFNSKLTSFEDLVQEGQIVLINLRKKKHDSSISKFSTLLTSCLINRYRNIRRDAYAAKRYVATVDYSDYSNTPSAATKANQHDILEKKEALERVRRIDSDIADLIEHGVSDELFNYVKNKTKIKASKNKSKESNRMSFSRALVEKFYGVKIDRIIKKSKKIIYSV